jgi:hypothetical protein
MRTISKAPPFFRMRRGLVSDSGALRAILKMLRDHLAGGVFAAAAASPDGKLALHFEQGARAVIDGIADLAVTYCVANAHVHVSQPLFDSRTAPKRPSGGKY